MDYANVALSVAQDAHEFESAARYSDAQSLSSAPVQHIALIGGFSPRRCGIATFTTDVYASLKSTFPSAKLDVYAVVPNKADAVQYGAPVLSVFAENDADSYRDLAAQINASGADVIWLQHEFGLFGGPAGRMILDLLEGLAAPLIITLHTVLPDPDEDQKIVMDALLSIASRVMVMSQSAAQLLRTVYGADPEQVVVIPHGVPDRPFGRGAQFKQKFGFTGSKLLMTFGLISPGKGLETAISALPAIVDKFPDTLYCIVGATHPNLIAREGEAYRNGLIALAEKLGVSDNLRWINAFLDIDELLDMIEAADIYLTPYLGAAQATSGTLSYAVALGKAVVSTPYAHARELLAEGHGVIIPFNDKAALENEVMALLAQPSELAALQQRAYLRGRSMIWPLFAAHSMDLMESVVKPSGSTTPIHSAGHAPLGDSGYLRMCDSVGMLQHSCFSVPDRSHGYCIDDNARALMLMNRLDNHKKTQSDHLALTFASFMQDAWNPSNQSFRNFMGFGRDWLEDTGSEDSNGRALWAIGSTVREGRTQPLRLWARRFYKQTSVCAPLLKSPRAIAFSMLGACHVLAVDPENPVALDIVRSGADMLSNLLCVTRRPDWSWFETMLAYDNCRLPEALIRAGVALERQDWVDCGLETLTWITQKQTSAKSGFRPIGSDSFSRDEYRLLPFDQQPVEAWATVDAAAAAFEASGDPNWLIHAERAYRWFFGDNDRGIALANIETGTCKDGLTARGVNENEGAESVLSLQLANCTLRRLKAITHPPMRSNVTHVRTVNA